MINVLILSCGTRNKVVQYFKRELAGKGKVIATDCSELAPALYEDDKHYIVPRITDDNYIDTILDICRKEKIIGVFSLIDPELSLLALHRSRFESEGVKIIGSDYELCERCLDKWQMYKWLSEKGYSCARSFINKNEFLKAVESGEISYPVFVKPIRGSASISIFKAYDKETVDLLFSHDNGLMIQEYLNGQEIGVDCYIDMISGEVCAIFTKKKILMRAGETDKSVSFIDDKLNNFILKFVKESGFRGMIDIDIFDIDGKYYISEVNPRFGGGYPHAYECGVNTPSMIINNLSGNINIPAKSNYEEGIFMMKYNEVKIKRI